MTEKERRRIIEKQEDCGQKVFCQGCGKLIKSCDDMSSVQYVRTKRKTEIFFHTECLPNIWKRRII